MSNPLITKEEVDEAQELLEKLILFCKRKKAKGQTSADLLLPRLLELKATLVDNRKFLENKGFITRSVH
jgi:hypothetical protein